VANVTVAKLHDIFEHTRVPLLLQRGIIAPRDPRLQRRTPRGAPRNCWA
jgi:hypothetical protein